MDIQIRRGTQQDIDSLEVLYNELNDQLAVGVNYPGWKKGIYPVRQTAVDGVHEGCLFVAACNGDELAGTMILRHEQELVYSSAPWQAELEEQEVLVVYTFAVSPWVHKSGVGTRMLRFAEQYAREKQVRALRLDVYDQNFPAIRLYESCGYRYIDTVSLGLENYGLNWFKLYEKLL